MGGGGEASFKYILNSTIYYLCEKQIHETHIDLSENFFFRRIKLMFTEKGWDQNPQFEGSCMDVELFGFQNIKGNSKEIWITKGFKIWHFPMFQ